MIAIETQRDFLLGIEGSVYLSMNTPALSCPRPAHATVCVQTEHNMKHFTSYNSYSDHHICCSCVSIKSFDLWLNTEIMCYLRGCDNEGHTVLRIINGPLLTSIYTLNLPGA